MSLVEPAPSFNPRRPAVSDASGGSIINVTSITARVEDFAKLALFLASDDSDYITGESIESDGGLLTAALKSTGNLARLRPTPD